MILGALLSKGVQFKLKNLRKTGSVTHPFWDRVVFKKTRALLGGNVTDITTGSAPINKDTLELANVTSCLIVVEGWGMTENCAVGSRFERRQMIGQVQGQWHGAALLN